MEHIRLHSMSVDSILRVSNDIVRTNKDGQVQKITLPEAQEMVFEADYTHSGSVTFTEFVELLSLTHESEL